jgi:hypothetical protein
MSTKFDVLVRYEEGAEVKATIGQRNLAAFEAQPFGNAHGALLRLRYAAYDSLRRLGRLPRGASGREPATWEEWDDLVDEVNDAGGEGEPDPTQPAAPAAG